jgi:hypothetical protein
MANIQGAYGHSDVFAPGVFDLYSARGTLATGQTITMQTSNLVLYTTGAITALTVNLPLNPPDGAVAEINVSGAGGSVTTLTLAANTGDSLSVAYATSLATNTPLRYKYSLNGDITKGVQSRTWFRVQ